MTGRIEAPDAAPQERGPLGGEGATGKGPKYIDLSEHTYELYDKLGITSYTIYSRAKEEFRKICILIAPTDSQQGEVVKECNFDPAPEEEEIIEKLAEALNEYAEPKEDFEDLEDIIKKKLGKTEIPVIVYDVSEYDTALLVIFP